MNPVSIAVLGGDLRQYYLANYLIQNGYDVIGYGNAHFVKLPKQNNTDCLEKALQQDIIIGPVPFTNDNHFLNADMEIPLTFFMDLKKTQALAGGNLPLFIQKQCEERNLTYYDYMKSDILAHQNAEITAEGALSEIIKNTPFILQNAEVLLIGYGKCGTMIAHKLNALGCKISICDKNEKRKNIAVAFGMEIYQMAGNENMLSKFQIIINTAPEVVFTKNYINKLQKDCVLVDIASAPGGVDWEAAKKAGIAAYHTLGLPGKTAPKTAGEVIAKDVINHLNIG